MKIALIILGVLLVVFIAYKISFDEKDQDDDDFMKRI